MSWEGEIFYLTNCHLNCLCWDVSNINAFSFLNIGDVLGIAQPLDIVLAIVSCKNKTINLLLSQINIKDKWDKWARTVHFCHRDHYLNSLCSNLGYKAGYIIMFI